MTLDTFTYLKPTCFTRLGELGYSSSSKYVVCFPYSLGHQTSISDSATSRVKRNFPFISKKVGKSIAEFFKVFFFFYKPSFSRGVISASKESSLMIVPFLELNLTFRILPDKMEFGLGKSKMASIPMFHFLFCNFGENLTACNFGSFRISKDIFL